LDGVHGAGQSAAINVLAENQGPAVDAFAAYWQKWSASGTGYLPACSQACIAMADALDRYATAVDAARRRVEELVAEVATAVVIGVALSIFTIGISDVAAGAVSAGLIASAAAVGFALSETAAAIAATILVGATLGAVEAMAIDAGAIQPEKILIFHDQQAFSWSEVLQWGEMGAAGGFIGGSLGAGLGAAGDALPTSISDLLATPLGGLVVGGVSGAGTTVIIDELQYGQVNPLDVAAGTVGGMAGGRINARLNVPEPDVPAPVVTRGGAGPVYQGQAGVNQAVADLEAAGGRVLGREITLDANGVRTRLDLFVELPNGKQVFLEIKTGPDAGLTPNQTQAFPDIRQGGAVPAGQHARDALLDPGVPLGPTEVWVVHEPWPLVP
jgi:hypothetical protein